MPKRPIASNPEHRHMNGRLEAELGRCSVMLRAEQQLIRNDSEYEKRHGQAKLAIF